MKGLILDREKYIVERSDHNLFVRRISIVAVIVFAFGVIAFLGAMGANNGRTASVNDVTNNDTSQFVGLDADKSEEHSQSIVGEEAPKQIKTEDKADVLVTRKDIPESYYVTKVVDGDTIYVSGIKTRIRLIGINTPEIHNGPVQCYGPEASNYLEQLILGKYVGLESDAASGDLDIYGRPLRYIYYNGENVNQKILLEGYGKEASYGSEYKYRAEFEESERNAISNNKGLWSPATCNGLE